MDNEFLSDMKIRCLTIALGYTLTTSEGVIVEMMYSFGPDTGSKYGKFLVWKNEKEGKVNVRLIDPLEVIYELDGGVRVAVTDLKLGT